MKPYLRRLRQFSLRSICLLTVIGALLFAYCEKQTRIERALIAQIRESGGSVSFGGQSWPQFWKQSVVEVTVPEQALPRITGANLKLFSSLKKVRIRYTNFAPTDNLFDAGANGGGRTLAAVPGMAVETSGTPSDIFTIGLSHGDGSGVADILDAIDHMHVSRVR